MYADNLLPDSSPLNKNILFVYLSVISQVLIQLLYYCSIMLSLYCFLFFLQITNPPSRMSKIPGEQSEHSIDKNKSSKIIEPSALLTTERDTFTTSSTSSPPTVAVNKSCLSSRRSKKKPIEKLQLSSMLSNNKSSSSSAGPVQNDVARNPLFASIRQNILKMEPLRKEFQFDCLTKSSTTLFQED